MKKIVAILALAALTAAPMPANSQGQWGNSFTADEARNARDKGDVVPLRDIFRQLKNRYGGYQVDANLYNRDRGQVYVIDWMTEKGERIRVTVDAKTGRTLSTN
ncbi:MAG: peptidase [Hyphomonadaceae bacterium]|nr:peptidase [Hyphomonadaceae bacterium]